MSEPELDLRATPDARRADAVKLRDAMEALITSDGWKTVEVFLLKQSTMRQQQLLQPLSSGDEIYEQEYKKGEAATFRVAAALPETLRKSAEDTLSIVPEEEQEEDV